MFKTALRLPLDWGLTRLGIEYPPRLLTHTLTFRCNARCSMCDSWKKQGHHDLTLTEIQNIYEQLPPLDAVRLTGGEPFLRTDLPQIVAMAQSFLKPQLIHITTNGFLTQKIIEFCQNRTHTIPLHLLISLDGRDSFHDSIRGVPGAFQRVMKTLITIVQQAKEWNVIPAINQTILDESGFEAYHELNQLIQPLGIAHQVVVAYAESATYTESSQKNKTTQYPGPFKTIRPLNPHTTHAFLQEIQKKINRSSPSYPLSVRIAKRYYLQGIENRLVHQKTLPNPPCAALGAHLRILPNGDVPVCQFNGTILGNLRETPFHHLWNNNSHQHWKKWVKKCPGCWAECEILPSALYSGDLLRAL